MIIGFSGKIGSGKDTAASFLLERPGFVRRAFGDALKEEAAMFVATNTAASANYGLKAMKIGFRTRRLILDAVYNYPRLWRNRYGDGWSYADALHAMHDPLLKKKFRLLLQVWGTEYRRKQCGENYWIDKLDEWVFHQTIGTTVLITDVRFPNEARYVSKNGHLVRLWRPGDPISDHISETALDDWPFIHHLRNSGDTETLRGRTVALYNSLCRQKT